MDKDISKKSASDKGSERANGRSPVGEYQPLPFGPETEMLALHSAIGNQAVGRLLQSSGQPLDPAERNFMESSFGHDFGQVRIHSDARADESARALNAKAYTIGNDIIFRAGQYIPETKEGRKLLAHELAHTIQQGNSTRRLQTKLEITHPGNTAEREAEDAAIKIARGQTSRVMSNRSPEIARAPFEEGEPIEEEAPGSVDPEDPVVLIEIRYGEPYLIGGKFYGYKTVFYTHNGLEVEAVTNKGNIKGLKPGSYTLRVKEKGGTQKWFEIQAAQTLSVKGKGFFDAIEGEIDPMNLTYIQDVTLKVVPAPERELFEMTVDERMAKISEPMRNKWTGINDEEEILRLLSETPISQAPKLLKKLTEEKIDGKSYLDALDDVIHGDNNLKLHEVLSELRLKALGPEKGAEALEKAPVLPWHESMGIFDTKAIFFASRTPEGKINIRYATGSKVLKSEYFQNETMNLGEALFLPQGRDYDPDQVFIIHDYDRNQYVPIVAQQLLKGYTHAVNRLTLTQLGTLAQFAFPLSAARTAAGRAAVFVIERAIPIMIELINENRLNIVKWFPTWGPRMLRYADMVAAGLALYGVAKFAVHGYKIIKRWKAVLLSRDELGPNKQAEKVARKLEKQADEIISQAEKIYAEEASAASAPEKVAGEAEVVTTTPKAPPGQRPPNGPTLTGEGSPASRQPRKPPHSIPPKKPTPVFGKARRPPSEAPSAGTESGPTDKSTRLQEIASQKAAEEKAAQAITKKKMVKRTFGVAEKELKPGVIRRRIIVTPKRNLLMPRKPKLVTRKSIGAVLERIEKMRAKGIESSSFNRMRNSQLASHAEVQQIVSDPSLERIAVTNEMCPNCIEYFRAEARFQSRTLEVSDPFYRREFHPDGSYTEFPKEGDSFPVKGH